MSKADTFFDNRALPPDHPEQLIRLRRQCAEAMGYLTRIHGSGEVELLFDVPTHQHYFFRPDQDDSQLVELMEFYGQYGSLHFNPGAEIYEFQPYFDYLKKGMKPYKQKGGNWRQAIMCAVAAVGENNG